MSDSRIRQIMPAGPGYVICHDYDDGEPGEAEPVVMWALVEYDDGDRWPITCVEAVYLSMEGDLETAAELARLRNVRNVRVEYRG